MKKQISWVALTIFLGIAVFGGLSGFFKLMDNEKYLEIRHNGSVTEGIVTDVDANPVRNGVQYHNYIRYTGTANAPFTNVSVTQAPKYKTGDRVIVYFDPRMPTVSYINAEPSYSKIIIGGSLLVIGISGASFMSRRIYLNSK